MALSSIMLVPPLYDMQKEISRMYAKFKDRVFEYQEDDTTAPDDAPKNAIVGFYTNMVDALYRYNVIRSSIKSQHDSMRSRAVLYYSIVVILVILCFSIFAWYVLWPRFYTQLDGFEVMTDNGIGYFMETIYFSILMIVVIPGYILYLTSQTLAKNLTIYNKVYQDDIFTSDDPITNVIEMMQINGDIQSKDIDNINTSNPMMVWWLTSLRGVNATNITFQSVNIISNPDVPACSDVVAVEEEEFDFTNWELKKDTKIAKSCNKTVALDCLDSKKEDINFVNKEMSRGEVLTTLMPCRSKRNKDKIFVQPFDVINQEAHKPEALLKNIKAYDLFNQVNRINDAMLYFKGFLLKENDNIVVALTPDEKQTMIISIVELLKVRFATTNDLTVYDVNANRLAQDPGGPKPCNTKCLDDPNCVTSIYDTTQKSCYHFKLEDMNSQKVMFKYDPTKASNAMIKSTGQITPAIIATDILINPVVIATAFKNKPMKSNMESVKGIEKQDVKSNFLIDPFSFCEMSKSFECVMDNAFTAPADVGYSAIFAENNGAKKNDTLFSYRTDLDTIVTNANTANSLNAMLVEFKVYLIGNVIGYLKEKDPVGSFDIDTVVVTSLQDNLRDFYGSTVWPIIASTFTDIINDIILSRDQKPDKAATEDDSAPSYITYDRFQAKLKQMNQADFATNFMGNIEELRSTSVGLNKLYQIFDYSTNISDRSNNMLNTTFSIVTIVGFCELVRYALNKYGAYIVEDQAILPHAYFLKKPDKSEEKDISLTIVDALLSPKEKTERSHRFLNYVIRVACVFMVYMLAVSLTYTWMQKSLVVYRYNNNIIETNGNLVLNTSKENFESLLFSIYKNKQLVTLSGADTIEIINALPDSSKYARLQQSVSNPKELVVMGNTFDCTDLYNGLIISTESFDKCNTLLTGANQTLPFPFMELSVYMLICIVLFVVAVIIVYQIKPFGKIRNIKYLMHMRTRLKKKEPIAKNDITFCDNDEDLTAERESMDFMVKWTAIILIILFTMLFTMTLINSTNSFAGALYSSDLFRNSQCYPL